MIKARDLKHTIQLISRHPGLNLGPRQVRPAADLDEMSEEANQAGANRTITAASIPTNSKQKSRRGLNHKCQKFVSQDLVFLWTVTAPG